MNLSELLRTYPDRVPSDLLGRAAALELVSIRAEALPRGGWRYTATAKDGAEYVVRAKATRLYPAAHVWDRTVCTGKSGLGAVVNFGAKPKNAWGVGAVLRSFPIAAPSPLAVGQAIHEAAERALAVQP
jgi:hypothetical protein